MVLVVFTYLKTANVYTNIFLSNFFEEFGQFSLGLTSSVASIYFNLAGPWTLDTSYIWYH